jgi:hypothetical protein
MNMARGRRQLNSLTPASQAYKKLMDCLPVHLGKLPQSSLAKTRFRLSTQHSAETKSAQIPMAALPVQVEINGDRLGL